MPRKTMLVTGGAGFIGVNASAYFAERGWDVIIFDNLSRKGADKNLDWLRSNRQIRFIQGDIRDAERVNRAVADHEPKAIIHLAAQVAVNSSVSNPRTDFEINALGTLNLLEGIRNHSPGTFLINASTNKVYGALENLDIVERERRYEFKANVEGVSESQPLNFQSPYACSKGAADQYTIDYDRIYGLNTVTLRQSCIYGPHQLGVEDQGWVAWFVIAALSKQRITIYGDGKQLRDVLYVGDLIDCYDRAIQRRAQIGGEVFNIGGGKENTVSLIELLDLIAQHAGEIQAVDTREWRPADQPVFVCDVRKAWNCLGWRPRTGIATGVEYLVEWFGSSMFVSSTLGVESVP
jgi:CDP-paratose 2-epimerase